MVRVIGGWVLICISLGGCVATDPVDQIAAASAFIAGMFLMVTGWAAAARSAR